MNLDVFQMQQCEMQAALFESLDRRPIDAKVFIRAFMNSKAAAGPLPVMMLPSCSTIAAV